MTSEHQIPALDSSVVAGQFVTFSLDDSRYAVALLAVRCVVRMVEITPLPGGPRIVSGVVNFRGEIIPVLDIRQRLGHPTREFEITDHMIVARTSKRTVAIAVDSANGVIEGLESEQTPADMISPGLDHVEGVIKAGQGLLLIHNLDTFLTFDEEEGLEQALHEPSDPQ